MIVKYMCGGCGTKHDILPYAGYRVGVDWAVGSDFPTIVITKFVPDGAGNFIHIVLDVRTGARTGARARSIS